MYVLHEALARERMREAEQRARDTRLASHATGERRYRRALRKQRRS